MKNVLFLSIVMTRGFGVSVALEQLSSRLMKAGVKVTIGCEHTDSSFKELDVRVLPKDLYQIHAIRALAEELSPVRIIAHTSPFFEHIPALAKDYECWAWENGDPTPEFFPEEEKDRKNIVRNKLFNVYPHARKVVAISDFIKHDINWRSAEVIYYGADHVPYLPEKKLADFDRSPDAPLKVGALMRIGSGEAQYKGNDLFIRLIKDLKKRDLNVEAHAAGRGNERDAMSFRDQGIQTHLNLSDHDKAEYLRQLDIFISFSLWEGFNLPLVEAQALGTLSLCLDSGAHPEVCPFVLSHPEEATRFIERALADKEWLCQKSALGYRFVRQNFTWQRTAARAMKLLAG